MLSITSLNDEAFGIHVSSGLLVDSKSVIVIEVLDPLFKTWVLQALVNGVGEELNVGVQGKLVHWVNTSHVVHHKEEDRSPLSTWTITLGRGGGMGRRYGEEVWGGGMGRRDGEEGWGGGMGSEW